MIEKYTAPCHTICMGGVEMSQIKIDRRKIAANPRVYVPYWFEQPGNGDNKNGIHFASLWLDYCEFVITIKDDKFQPVSLKNMEMAFGEHLIKMPLLKMAEIAENLKTTGENLLPLQNWVDSIGMSKNPNDVQVMAHWCWQVKRKALNLPIIHHIMPVVVGKQGSGKTMAISKLIGPWESTRLNAALDMLNDHSTYQSLATHLVVMFDELAGVQRVDMNTLKRQISAETNSYRPLYRQQMVTVPQRCSFIGASNTHIDESIFDATGMRRFYQIISPDKTDWAATNAIDYGALWRGIDENRADGYMTGTILSSVHNTQKDYVVQSGIDAFIDINDLVPAVGANTKEMQAKDLFEIYKDYEKTSNIKHTVELISFNRKLKNRGVPTYEKRVGNSPRVRHFSINADSPLLGLRPQTEPTGQNVLEWKGSAV